MFEYHNIMGISSMIQVKYSKLLRSTTAAVPVLVGDRLYFQYIGALWRILRHVKLIFVNGFVVKKI